MRHPLLSEMRDSFADADLKADVIIFKRSGENGDSRFYKPKFSKQISLILHPFGPLFFCFLFLFFFDRCCCCCWRRYVTVVNVKVLTVIMIECGDHN